MHGGNQVVLAQKVWELRARNAAVISFFEKKLEEEPMTISPIFES